MNLLFFAFCLLCIPTNGIVNDVLLQFVENAIQEALSSSGDITSSGEVLGKATLILKNEHGIENFEEANKHLFSSNMSFPTFDEAKCSRPPKDCQDPVHDSVRSITGYCNNRKIPTQANSGTPIRRLLGTTSYADGIQQIRYKSITGKPLPSARLISNKLHDTGSAVYESPNINHLHMQIGQFVAHDLIFMPSSTGTNGASLDCSSCSSPSSVSPNCAPIEVPKDDKYFTTSGEPRCLRLTRALNGQNGLGVRTQTDQNTHFLDMSTVYGSSDCEGESVRLFSNGLLKTYNGMGYVLPPQNKNDVNCQSKNPYYCFTAGDFRNSLHPGLLPLHTVFLKEHNRLATSIKSMRSSWNDEQIFQLTRKIMIAQWQHVVYNEYLPKLLNAEFMSKFELTSGGSGGGGGYNPSASAVLSVEFAAAAFRFGHSQVRQHFKKKNASMTTIDTYDLGRNTFYADEVYEKSKGGWESMLLGLIGSGSMQVDRYFSFPIRNQLFEIRGKPGSGVDLVAVNIMRGRDVGLLPYTKYRSLVGLPRVSTWNDLSPTFSGENIAALKTVYADPADIDLFTGIVMEQPLSGSQLGPTASWMIAEQFKASKSGDRFFYDHKVQQTHGFTSEQIAEIRKVKLGKILCNNMEMISSISADIFEKRSRQVACSSLPNLNIKLFL